MKTSPNGIKFLKNHEGCRLHAYPDPESALFKECEKRKISPYSGGYKAIKNWPNIKALPWTIGYGHTNNVRPDDVITQAQADKLLLIELVPRENAINKLVKVPLTQNQFDALVSFVYNEGIAALQKSTLLRKLNAKDYIGAANELIHVKGTNERGRDIYDGWIYAGGAISNGLVTRRKDEKALFLKK